MNRVIRGMAGLIVALGASACANDYSLDFGGDPTHVQASPTAMFINQGETEVLLVRLVNDRNQSVLAKFEASNIGDGITVVYDEEYRPDNVGSETLTPNEALGQARFFVTANAPVGTTFTVSAGGLSTEIRVRVVPVSLPLTAEGGGSGVAATALSNSSFLFSDGTTFEASGLLLPTAGVSEDGHTINVILPPGLADGDLTVGGAEASYIPGLGLPAIPGTGITTGAYAPLAGTDDVDGGTPTPVIAIGENGGGWIDLGSFTGPDYVGGGGPVKWYYFSIPVDMPNAAIAVEWPGSGDFDIFLIDGGFNTILGSAASSPNPEVIHHELPAGTYILGVLNYQNSTNAPWFTVRILPEG